MQGPYGSGRPTATCAHTASSMAVCCRWRRFRTLACCTLLLLLLLLAASDTWRGPRPMATTGWHGQTLSSRSSSRSTPAQRSSAAASASGGQVAPQPPQRPKSQHAVVSSRCARCRACEAGEADGQHQQGGVDLFGGTCTGWCSRANRCGIGHNYMGKGSTDCCGCRPVFQYPGGTPPPNLLLPRRCDRRYQRGPSPPIAPWALAIHGFAQRCAARYNASAYHATAISKPSVTAADATAPAQPSLVDAVCTDETSVVRINPNPWLTTVDSTYEQEKDHDAFNLPPTPASGAVPRLGLPGLTAPNRLASFEFSCYSEGPLDGILLALLTALGVPSLDDE
jgi:hypothetical protein